MKKLLLLLFMIPVVFACDPNFEECAAWDSEDVDWNTIDYADPTLYTDAEFLANAPAEVYQDPHFDYSQLDYTQANYENIVHERVDSSKYFTDTGCTHCKLDVQSEGHIRFSESGIAHGSATDFIPVPGNPPYPRGAEIVVEQDKLVLTLVQDYKTALYDPYTLQLPSDAHFTIETYEPVKIEGIGIIEGTASIDNNEITLGKVSRITYKGVVFDSRLDESVKVYFDGEQHDDASYVSFGNTNIEARVAGSARMSFAQPNPYLPHNQKGDYAIISLDAASLSLNNFEDSIPRIVTHAQNPESVVKIESGLNEVWSDAGDVRVRRNAIDEDIETLRRPIAMEIQMYSPSDFPYLGQTLIETDDARFLADKSMVISEDGDIEMTHQHNRETLSLRYQRDHIPTLEELRKKHQIPIESDLEGLEIPIDSYLDALTRKQRESIKGLYVLSGANYYAEEKRRGLQTHTTGGFAVHEGPIYLNSESMRADGVRTLKHEATHSLYHRDEEANPTSLGTIQESKAKIKYWDQALQDEKKAIAIFDWQSAEVVPSEKGLEEWKKPSRFGNDDNTEGRGHCKNAHACKNGHEFVAALSELSPSYVLEITSQTGPSARRLRTYALKMCDDGVYDTDTCVKLYERELEKIQ